MISSKDLFLEQQIIESQERLRRVKTMSRDERDTLKKFERYGPIKIYSNARTTGKKGK